MKRALAPATASIAALLALAIAAMIISLLVTPAQTIRVSGQAIDVSAAPTLSLSGPGELDLFGKSIPTKQQFSGPIRLRLHWGQVTHYDELAAGVQHPGDLGGQLLGAWTAYFTRQFAVSVICASFLAALVLATIRPRPRIWIAGIVLALASGALVDGVAVTAVSTSARTVVQQVHSLDDVAGRAPLNVAPAPAPAPTHPGTVEAVVIGDSTAAGVGNTPLPGGTHQDVACRRSSDAYALDIAAVNRRTVINLACTNATIASGLFGSENINGVTVPPQLGTLQSIPNVNVVIVSIGANEMHWHEFMNLCLATESCDDAISAAWFEQTLNDFTVNYYDLMQQLAQLPGHPRVIVNEYYAPVGPTPQCPATYGLTASKATALLLRLKSFNTVLHDGAIGFGFVPVMPDFSGHELCTGQPWVQGPKDAAPLHPNAAGELAIALADEEALLRGSADLSKPTAG